MSPAPGRPSDGEAADEYDLGGPVRPYVVTGGRSRPSRNTLSLVTLVVSAAPSGPLPVTLTPEHKRITALCRQLLSVAEVAAHLRLPVSVTKVLVADLLDGGHIIARAPTEARAPASTAGDAAPTPNRRPDRALLEEVLHGLRALG